MKKCKMCNVEFDNNIYSFCDLCIEIDNAVINRLYVENLSEKDENRFRKVLRILRQE